MEIDHLPHSIDIFYLINVDKKSTFLDNLPTSSCQRSLWTPPYSLYLLYQEALESSTYSELDFSVKGLLIP